MEVFLLFQSVFLVCVGIINVFASLDLKKKRKLIERLIKESEERESKIYSLRDRIGELQVSYDTLTRDLGAFKEHRDKLQLERDEQYRQAELLRKQRDELAEVVDKTFSFLKSNIDEFQKQFKKKD